MGRKGNSGKSNKLPERWNNYTTMGNIVPGTRFLPFKTPLKEEICKKWFPEEDSKWFTPAKVLEKVPNLKLVIDLTQTDRYYKSEDFKKNGVLHRKIVCPGGGRVLPPPYIIQRFNTIIDSFLVSEAGLKEDALIGVHCTHGLNRTGYLICKYMVEKSGVSAQGAIDAFETARGHKMERPLYVLDIINGTSRPMSRQHSEPRYRKTNNYALANRNRYFRKGVSDEPSYTSNRRFAQHDYGNNYQQQRYSDYSYTSPSRRTYHHNYPPTDNYDNHNSYNQSRYRYYKANYN